MATKTAIITGACSGMGLSLTEHLLSLPNWRVVMGDIQPPPASLNLDLNRARALYVKVDVSSWSENAVLFKAAYNWPGDATGRIDFLAANAGTADKESVYGHFDLDAEPEAPNLKCIEVDLLSVFYVLKLFIHYSRKTQRDLKDAVTMFNPKMVITASCVGQYQVSIILACYICSWSLTSGNSPFPAVSYCATILRLETWARRADAKCW
jgi:15-hydroxyprostaglandin dehydrogenase (NAD)